MELNQKCGPVKMIRLHFPTEDDFKALSANSDLKKKIEIWNAALAREPLARPDTLQLSRSIANNSTFRRVVSSRGGLTNWQPCAMIPISEFPTMFLGNYTLSLLPELEGIFRFGKMMFTSSRLTVRHSMAIVIAPPARVNHFNDIAQMHLRSAARSIVALKGPQLECWVVEPAGNIVRPDSTVKSLLASLFKLQLEFTGGEEGAEEGNRHREGSNFPYYAVAAPRTERWESRDASCENQSVLVPFLTVFVDEALFARTLQIPKIDVNDSTDEYSRLRHQPQLVQVFVALRVFDLEVVDSEAFIIFEVVHESLLEDPYTMIGEDNENGGSGGGCDVAGIDNNRIKAAFPVEELFLARCSITEQQQQQSAVDSDDVKRTREADEEGDAAARKPTRKERFGHLLPVVGSNVAPAVQIVEELGVGIGVARGMDLRQHAERLEADEQLRTMRNYALEATRQLRQEHGENEETRRQRLSKERRHRRH